MPSIKQQVVNLLKKWKKNFNSRFSSIELDLFSINKRLKKIEEKLFSKFVGIQPLEESNMKITKRQLKFLIKEQLSDTIREFAAPQAPQPQIADNPATTTNPQSFVQKVNAVVKEWEPVTAEGRKYQGQLIELLQNAPQLAEGGPKTPEEVPAGWREAK